MLNILYVDPNTGAGGDSRAKRGDKREIFVACSCLN